MSSTGSFKMVATRSPSGCNAHARRSAISSLSHARNLRDRAKPLIQPKLKLGPAGDRFEQEADRVAEQVMRMPGIGCSPPAVQGSNSRAALVQRSCAACGKAHKQPKRQERPDITGTLCPKCRAQAKPASGEAPAITADLASGIQGLRGGGRYLNDGTRSFFESRFGHDFSQVRVHDGARATHLASALNARAFTLGNDVVFGAGQYRPHNSQGRHLLAHELTHVLQQSGQHTAIQRQEEEAAAASPAAPEAEGAACASTKSVTIDLVKLEGSNRNPTADLAFANNVFRQCCVQFNTGQSRIATRAQTLSWLNGDTNLSRIHSCSNVHAEEESLRSNATSTFTLNSRYKAFYVGSMSPALNGVNFSPDCSSGARAPFNRHLYISNSANQRTLAHELGHIPIVGLADHTTHGGTANNLMIPNGPGSELTARQCGEVYANV